jgi:hypothetical protein
LTRTLRGNLGAPGLYRLQITIRTAAQRDRAELRVGAGRAQALVLRRSAPSVVTVTVALATPALVVSVSGARRLPAVGLTAIRARPPGGAPTPSIAVLTLAGGLVSPPAPAGGGSTPAAGSGGSSTSPSGRSGGSVSSPANPSSTLSVPAFTAHRGGLARPASYSRLVWSDEFAAPAGGRPDSATWRYDTGVWDQASLDTDTAGGANIRTDGRGNLEIVARAKSPAGAGRAARPYTSGRIETARRFSFTYGRLEARIKVPAGAGLWPAFWLLGDSIDTIGWPRSGEIDAMENFGRQPGTVLGTIHGPVLTGKATRYQVQGHASGPSLAGTYHTYGVVWQPGQITWTLDERAYAEARSSQLPAGSWVFDHQPFHIVISLAVGGPDAGSPRASTLFPARLRVDWIRLYQ